MNNEKSENTLLRLAIGLVAGVLIGLVLGQGVDIIGNSISTLAATLALVFGFASTFLLKEGSPRRTKPSSTGTFALLLVLACYLYIGRLVFVRTSALWIGLYILAGLAIAWLVFTSTAETSLLSAFGIGGFCSGFIGILFTFIAPEHFAPLFSMLLQPDEKTLVYTQISLICAIPGAFAAVAGRLSGWGLAETTKEEVWAFASDGRLFTKKVVR